jgi:hypothetical protein
MKGIGDVRSSSTTRRKESNFQQQRIVQSAVEPTTMAGHPKEFASMTGSL